jgi:hypothetical protein
MYVLLVVYLIALQPTTAIVAPCNRSAVISLVRIQFTRAGRVFFPSNGKGFPASAHNVVGNGQWRPLATRGQPREDLAVVQRAPASQVGSARRWRCLAYLNFRVRSEAPSSDVACNVESHESTTTLLACQKTAAVPTLSPTSLGRRTWRLLCGMEESRTGWVTPRLAGSFAHERDERNAK